MPRAPEDVVGGTLLDDAPPVHDGDPVRHSRDDGEIVRDEERRETVSLSEIDQQVQDLRGHRDVERGDGLVAHDELRTRRQRPRDRDALSLSARELSGEPRRRRGRQADLLQEGRDPLADLAPGNDPLDAQGLGDLGAGAHPGVQRALRILKDDLRVAPPPPERASGEGEPVLALESDPAGGRRLEPQQEPADRALSAPRLPDEAECLAPADGERDAVDRTEGTRSREERAALRIDLGEVRGLEKDGPGRAQRDSRARAVPEPTFA